jgi:hypothetical protein
LLTRDSCSGFTHSLVMGALPITIRDKIMYMKAKSWLKLSPETIIAILVTAVVAPVPLAWTANSNHLFDTANVALVHTSSPSLPYGNDTYSDIEVSVENQGNATAEGCLLKVLGSAPDSEDPAEAVTLAESERFDLSPQDGRVLTMRVYLPDADEKQISFGAACEQIRPSQDA